MDDKKLTTDGQGAAANPVEAAEAPSLMEAQMDKTSAVSNMPKSQAVLDIEANAAEVKEEKKSGPAKSASAPQNLAAVARFRWVLLFVLSLAAIIFWTAEAQVSDRSYKFLALGYLALGLIVTIPTMKFLHIPTRGGLAAMLWAGTFFISACSGEDLTRLFEGAIPAALPWGGLLAMILLWMAVAVWRKVGRYKVIDIVLAVVIIYAALSPVLALSSGIASGDVLSMNFQDLTNSPFFLTNNLPWFLWPMSAIVALILPLCALFALWDQLSILKRRGARHAGNILLALAFLLLIPYGFVTYDKAVREMPITAESMVKWNPLSPLIPSDETTASVPTETIEVEPAPKEPIEVLELPTAEAPEEQAAPVEEAQEQDAPEKAAMIPPPAAVVPEVVETLEPPATTEDKITDLENTLNSANTRINTLERRLENLSRELEQLKRGIHPIPTPPTSPAPPMEAPDPAFSSNT